VETASLFYKDLYKAPKANSRVLDAQNEILSFWKEKVPNTLPIYDGNITLEEILPGGHQYPVFYFGKWRKPLFLFPPR